MPTLTEIGGHLAALDALLDEAAGELTPELEGWLAEYQALEAGKVDSYASMVKHYLAVAVACEAQSTELAMKAATNANRAKWLMTKMGDHLTALGRDEAKGLVWAFKYAKNGGKLPLEITGPVPEAFQRVAVSPDNEKIRAHMDLVGATELSANGQVFARMGERGRSLRLR
jgi:hypothetical protein